MTTNRQGQYWSVDEQTRLIYEMEKRVPIETIAKNHERSKRAIELRFLSYIRNELKNKSATIRELAERFGKKEEELLNELDKLENKEDGIKDDRMYNELKEVNKKLDRIEKILTILFSKKKKNPINKS